MFRLAFFIIQQHPHFLKRRVKPLNDYFNRSIRFFLAEPSS